MERQNSSTGTAFQIDRLKVRVYQDRAALAQDAAEEVHQFLKERLRVNGSAAAILATGNSQIDFLDRVIALGGVEWSRVTLFHMDEYLGLDGNHQASFRRYMRERVAQRVHPRVFHYLEGDALLPLKECVRYSELLQKQPIDLCCLGVGENGHIAFNDPEVADFADPWAVKLVKLDLRCQQQQVGEGHFPDIAAVPQYAFTLTIPTLCAVGKMVCICPEQRKAEAVKSMLRGPVDPSCPASFLRRQPHATLLLDSESASFLDLS